MQKLKDGMIVKLHASREVLYKYNRGQDPWYADPKQTIANGIVWAYVHRQPLIVVNAHVESNRWVCDLKTEYGNVFPHFYAWELTKVYKPLFYIKVEYKLFKQSKLSRMCKRILRKDIRLHAKYAEKELLLLLTITNLQPEHRNVVTDLVRQFDKDIADLIKYTDVYRKFLEGKKDEQ